MFLEKKRGSSKPWAVTSFQTRLSMHSSSAATSSSSATVSAAPGSVRKSGPRKNWLKNSPGQTSPDGSGSKPSHAINADWSPH